MRRPPQHRVLVFRGAVRRRHTRHEEETSVQSRSGRPTRHRSPAPLHLRLYRSGKCAPVFCHSERRLPAGVVFNVGVAEITANVIKTSYFSFSSRRRRYCPARRGRSWLPIWRPIAAGRAGDALTDRFPHRNRVRVRRRVLPFPRSACCLRPSAAACFGCAAILALRLFAENFEGRFAVDGIFVNAGDERIC